MDVRRMSQLPEIHLKLWTKPPETISGERQLEFRANVIFGLGSDGTHIVVTGLASLDQDASYKVTEETAAAALHDVLQKAAGLTTEAIKQCIERSKRPCDDS